MNDIKNDNKLIANFMEYKTNTHNQCYRKNLGELGWEYIQFNTSWDWLMLVVEKIESKEDKHHGYFGVHISSNSCTIQGTNFRSEKIVEPPVYFSNWVLEDKISSTYKAVVEFIKWYNQQSQTNQ